MHRPPPNLVFISYCHADRDWMRRLMILLAPVVRNRRLEPWADEHIKVGDEWRRDIFSAVSRVRLAVCLVTADFLDAIGFDAVHADTAAGALERVAAGGVDLAVIGGSLPDMRAADLALRVRALAPGLPIVLASGYDAETLAQRFSTDSALSRG